jgi:hypothetical protein
MRTTPGIARIRERFSASNRQKTYPGNNGSCRTLMRSDHRRRDQNVGKNSSNPLYRSAFETVLSNRDFTRIANQGRFPQHNEHPHETVDPVRSGWIVCGVPAAGSLLPSRNLPASQSSFGLKKISISPRPHDTTMLATRGLAPLGSHISDPQSMVARDAGLCGLAPDGYCRPHHLASTQLWVTNPHPKVEVMLSAPSASRKGRNVIHIENGLVPSYLSHTFPGV